MNSGISNFGKTIEECVNYNFDDDSPPIKSDKRKRTSRISDIKVNGELTTKITNWSEFKDFYSWLYVQNHNPKCSFCEQAINSDLDVPASCWTDWDTPLEIDNGLSQPSEILEMHSNSENHIKAYTYLIENLLIDKSKMDKENKQIANDNCPQSLSVSQWEQMRKPFSWLFYKSNSFYCSYCEEAFDKQRKFNWPCTDRMKPVASRFEKHNNSPNHIMAIDILKGVTDADNKDKEEPKASSPTRKSINFSPPNVTTRTSILKLQVDQSTIPSFLDVDKWSTFQKEFPWLFSNKDLLRCSYCEDAYKDHRESMTPSIWTCPDPNNYRPTPSLTANNIRSRLTRHESTKNHEIASKFVSNEASLCQSELEKENQSQSVIDSPVADFPAPRIIKTSRKSAPVKLISMEDNSDKSTESSSRKRPAAKSEKFMSESPCKPVLPSFLSQKEFESTMDKYTWFICKGSTSYGCSTCLDAMQMQPHRMSKACFTMDYEPINPNLSYRQFRKKLYRHSQSKNHSIATIIINQPIPTEIQSKNSPPKSSESRFTRLKTGSRVKIDYKRMSEGLHDENREDSAQVPTNVLMSPITNKRRKNVPPPATSSSDELMCPQCISHFSNTDALIQHISLCDYQPADSTKQLACPCNPSTFRFDAITKLDLHAAQEHDTQSYFHCYICSDRYNRLVLLYNHMMVNHLITWDPFEAYPADPFLCMFCSSVHTTYARLMHHYCHSSCNAYFQPRVVIVDDISITTTSVASEEVTVLDVNESSDEKEVIYSPVKKMSYKHNRIGRNSSLRRFGSPKAKKSKENCKSPERKSEPTQSQNITYVETADSLKEESKPDIIDQSKLEQVNSDIKSEVGSNLLITDDQIIDSQISSTPNQIDVLTEVPISDQPASPPIITSLTNQIDSEKIVSVTELPNIDSQSTSTINSPNKTDSDVKLDNNDQSISNAQQIDPLVSNPSTDSQKIDSNASSNDPTNQPKVDSSTNTPANDISTKIRRQRTLKKLFPVEMASTEAEPIKKRRGRKSLKQIQAELGILQSPSVDPNDESPPQQHLKIIKSKKANIKIDTQMSPSKKLKSIDKTTDDEISPSLSFMDRMKKIRQLKKIRTEQEREQMMAMDQKIAEINENLPSKPVVTSSYNYSIDEITALVQMKSHHHKLASKRRKSLNTDGDDVPAKKSRLEKPKTTPSPSRAELVSCNVCQLKFKSLRARDNHTTAFHKGLKLFSCKSCEVSFTTHILLRKHAQKYHIDNVSFAVFGYEAGSDVSCFLQCSFCPLQFTSRSGLNHHITSGHRLETDNGVTVDESISKLISADPSHSPQTCLVCQDILDNEFELDIHTIAHQKECQSPGTETAQFACPKCCRLFFGRDGKSYLKDHYNIIHLQRQLPVCEECNTRFNSTVCYSLHRKLAKNCSKRTAEQLKIEDPYNSLNNPMKWAFVCSKCQTLVAGESAQERFEQHQSICSVNISNEELLMVTDCATTDGPAADSGLVGQ